MRRIRPILAVVVAVVVLALVGVVGWRLYPRLAADRHEARPASAAPAALNGTVLRFEPGAPQLSYLKIQVAEVAPEPLIEPLTGRIAYDDNRTARVSSPIDGRVSRIEVQLGQKVTRGTVLAWLDAPDYAQAVADLRRDEIEVKQRQLVFERAKLLFDGEVMPRKEFEAAEADLREAEVELARARKRVEALGQDGLSARGEFALRAPLAGVVTERAINPGTQAGPDTGKPLFVISDPDRLWVAVDLPEHNLGVLAAGQRVSVEADAYPGKMFEATVVNVGDVLDAATRRVQVRCALDNPGRLLKPEMYARVTPLAASGAQLVRLPNAALVTVGVESYAFVEREPGVLERRKVVTALQGRDFSFLRDGIAPGERVVVSGALLLNAELQGN
jgi:cobalt-zinc-cadmium efflux system membrane fusion protein